MAQANRSSPKYIYELPYFERMELCKILDQNDKWEELGGVYMNFDVMTIHVLRKEILRGNSPADGLLTKWGHQNHTILELFVLLSKMQHYQAMLIIKQFVDSEYHRLIYEGEENLSRIFKPTNFSSDGHERNTSNREIPQTSLNNGDNQAHSSKEEFVNMNFSKSSNMSQDKISFPVNADVDHNVERKILNVEYIPPNQPVNENQSHRSNAQTVLMNRRDNSLAAVAAAAATLDRTDLLPPKLSRAESLKDKNVSEISSIAESVGILPVITFKELEIATNGWDQSTILGKGGFGTVYKGTWKNTQVAIKRTRNPETDENHTVQIQQILGELKMLNSYRHDNILPLYGFSMGGDDPCLIYQYMPNGSLEDRLLCRQGTKPLSWLQRHNIATGTARGLQFLHTIGEKPLIHGDIKSANILLDSNFEPKIGDFGLAREGPYNHYTHMKVSRVHGTRPYLPDEFLRHKKFSTKVDTHSFGIVLFELVTGLRAYDDQRPQHKFLKDLVENTPEQQLEYLVDKKCGPDEQHTFPNLIKLGKRCVSKKPKDRPEMVLVLQELNAMAVKRDMMVRAQSMFQQNTLTPSNPYEMQVLHDLSQQRRASLTNSPTPGRAVSPLVPQQEGDLSNVVPESTQSPNFANNPFLPCEDLLEKLQKKELGSSNLNNSETSPTSPKENENRSSAKIWNTGIVPPHLLQKIKEHQQAGINQTPKISISPPSGSLSASFSAEEEREQPIYSSASQDQIDDDDHRYMSQYVLPLISELGVKPKPEDVKEPEKSNATNLVEESIGDVVESVNTSAKGKPIWILGDSN